MKTRRYMVRCDIEGVTGVVSYEQAEPGKPEYAFGQRMLMSDLLALLGGLVEGGADEVVIYDEHFYGRNIDLDRLPASASVICGKPPYRPDWAGGLDATFAGAILMGYHAKAGTPGALLPHTYELETEDIRLNGVSVGEIGVEAAIAGDFGVPALLVSGDSACVREAESLLPGIAAVTVKTALSATGALCYPAAVTAARIREAAAAAVRAPPPVKPYRIGPRADLAVRLRDGACLGEVRRSHMGALVDAHTLRLEGPTATDVWARYLAIKNACASGGASGNHDT